MDEVYVPSLHETYGHLFNLSNDLIAMAEGMKDLLARDADIKQIEYYANILQSIIDSEKDTISRYQKVKQLLERLEDNDCKSCF